MRWQAVLFDLDGTLLDLSMREFVPHYFRALTAWAARYGVEPAHFTARLQAATAAMMRNQRPETNARVFARHFFPLAGKGEAYWRPIFDAFYREAFPSLRHLSRPRPAARRVVETALAQGYPVALATNPLFPEAAVRQRMVWAGVDDLPFALVTTYETCRASKPAAAYFREVCARLGAPPEACLMVGDEPMDLAASQVGLATYWVHPPGAAGPTTPPGPATWHGPLEGVLDIL